MKGNSIAVIVALALVMMLTGPSIFAQDKQPAAPQPTSVTAAPAAPAKPDKPAAAKPQDTLKQIQSKAAVAADSDSYIIGPEDVLYIYVWKEENLSRSVPVRMDGMISIPLVDDVKAAGMTPLQLKEYLLAKLREYVETPDVTVIVSEANSYRVFVQGEVKTPGVFKLRSETTLVQLIIMAGGFTDWANQKKITVMRKEGGKDTRIVVNYKKIIEGDSGEKDIVLKSGDIIIIPN
ncbi:MAG TPA: polysaccharide biosynthesis/export family protein [Syntrophales bacterium]|nr:polysaccharide biosynthesis/export family protein [Syntrophales bacterium]